MPLYVNDGKSPLESGGGTETFTQPVHDALSHADIPGVEDRASAAMVGDLVLTDSSAANQILDPNGAERLVTLPAIATTNPPFCIFNTGYYLIRVVDAGANYVVDVEPGQAVRLVSDGASLWRVRGRERTAQAITGQIYSFGGDLAAGNQFFRPNGQFDTGNAGTTVDGPGSFHVIQVAGVIDEICFFLGAENQTETLEVFLDGSLARTVSVNGAGDPNDGGGCLKIVPLTVAVGQRLAVRSQTATATCMFQFRVRSSTEGYLCQFGGDITADDAYYGVVENAATNKGSLTAGADHIVTLYAPAGGGNLTQIAYSIQGADTADQIDIFIGGVLAETVTLASGAVVNGNLVGTEALATSSFVNGDTLAIRGKDFTNMNDSVISLLSDVPGHLIHYKGDPAARVYWEVWHETVSDAGADVANERSKGMIQRRGRAILTWYSTNTPTSGFVVVRKRDRRSATTIVDTTTGTSGAVSVPLTYEPEDLVQVGSLDGAEGQTSIAIIIQ